MYRPEFSTGEGGSNFTLIARRSVGTAGGGLTLWSPFCPPRRPLVSPRGPSRLVGHFLRLRSQGPQPAPRALFPRVSLKHPSFLGLHGRAACLAAGAVFFPGPHVCASHRGGEAASLESPLAGQRCARASGHRSLPASPATADLSKGNTHETSQLFSTFAQTLEGKENLCKSTVLYVLPDELKCTVTYHYAVVNSKRTIMPC